MDSFFTALFLPFYRFSLWRLRRIYIFVCTDIKINICNHHIPYTFYGYAIGNISFTTFFRVIVKNGELKINRFAFIFLLQSIWKTKFSMECECCLKFYLELLIMGEEIHFTILFIHHHIIGIGWCLATSQSFWNSLNNTVYLSFIYIIRILESYDKNKQRILFLH